MESQGFETARSALDAAESAIGQARLGILRMAEENAVVADVVHNVAGVDPFVFHFAIFVMAIFVGYYVVWQVTPALHTPLMSVTNAISSVIIVGALLTVGISASGAATTFGFFGLILASINIFGGFLVTQRMLAMYKKKDR